MPLSNPDTFYLTAEEYGQQTTVPTLVNQLPGNQVTSLLLETMAEIDGYIGGGWTPFDDEQEFIFPRCQDTDSEDNAVIPRPVSLATRMIADAILSKRVKGVLPHELAGESNLGHTYNKRQRTIEPPLGLEHWPPQAFVHLDRYCHHGGQLAVDDPSLADC